MCYNMLQTIYTYVCIHIHIHIHMCIYVYIHIYIYREREISIHMCYRRHNLCGRFTIFVIYYLGNKCLTQHNLPAYCSVCGLSWHTIYRHTAVAA